MVVILLGVDAKTQYHHIQKGRFRQLHTPCTVVITGTELHLIYPGTVSISLQQRRVTTAIAIGPRCSDQLQLRTFNPIQLDLDRAARAAVCGIQNVRSQTSH